MILINVFLVQYLSLPPETRVKKSVLRLNGAPNHDGGRAVAMAQECFCYRHMEVSSSHLVLEGGTRVSRSPDAVRGHFAPLLACLRWFCYSWVHASKAFGELKDIER